MMRQLKTLIFAIVLLISSAGVSYALRPIAASRVIEIVNRLAMAMQRGDPYTKKDAEGWKEARKWAKEASLHVNAALQARYDDLRESEGKIFFAEKKTWNDAYVWLQILQQLQEIRGAKPQSILEVGPGYDPTLTLTAEALGFDGTYSWMDRSKDRGEELKLKLADVGIFAKELILEDIFTFVTKGRRFDLLLFKHFFDDFFIGLHKKGYGKRSDWKTAISKESEYTEQICELVSKLPDLLNAAGVIVINEYPARPGYIVGEIGPENLRRRLVARVLEELKTNPKIDDITSKIDFSKIDGSPVSLFPGSFHIFIAKPQAPSIGNDLPDTPIIQLYAPSGCFSARGAHAFSPKG